MKKIGMLFMALCLVLGIIAVPVLAETTQTVWDGFDANVVNSGEDPYWSNDGLSVYSDGEVTGFIAPENSSGTTKTTSDTAFENTTVKKREWSKMSAKNAITSEDALRYELSFNMTSVEGAYSAGHSGTYIILRSDTFSNYLDNRLMLNIKRDHNGIPTISLKTAAQGSTSGYLNISNENITLLGTTIKIVDNFNTNIIKVYATDTYGEFQLIGTVTLDLETNSATLTTADGTTQTRTGYANAISGTSTTPGFILAENAAVISDVKVTYPIPGPTGVAVSKASGIYAGYPEIELSTPDAEGVIYYTLDESDPVTSGTEYTGGALDLSGIELPGTVTLKVTEKLAEEYSDVAAYEYTIYPANASYTLVPTEVNEGTSADFAYGNSFVMGTITEENDGFTTADSANSWSRVYSKFKVPVAAGGMEYNFKMKNLGAEGDTIFGVYISLSAGSTEQMTSTTVPYLYLNRNGIGFRKSSAWSGSASEMINYGDGIVIDESTHNVRIVNRFADETEVYFDDELVATCTISDGTFTVTNTDGESISRTGVVTATDYAYANIALYRGANTTTVADFTVSYPVSPTVKITTEIPKLTVGDEITLEVSADENATVYYTLDGSEPNEESSVYDGGIAVPGLSEPGTVTVKVRAYKDGLWSAVKTAALTYEKAKILGDADDDGKITVFDAVCVLKMAAGITEISDDALTVADLDGDEAISTTDALKILRYIAGISNTLVEAI